jgi:hypothetical protein
MRDELGEAGGLYEGPDELPEPDDVPEPLGPTTPVKTGPG